MSRNRHDALGKPLRIEMSPEICIEWESSLKIIIRIITFISFLFRVFTVSNMPHSQSVWPKLTWKRRANNFGFEKPNVTISVPCQMWLFRGGKSPWRKTASKFSNSPTFKNRNDCLTKEVVFKFDKVKVIGLVFCIYL